jgi:hypothetical protein
VVLAAVLLLQTIVLVTVALSILKVRKPLEALIASTHELLGIARHRAQQLDVTRERIGQVFQKRNEQADVSPRNPWQRARSAFRPSISSFVISFASWNMSPMKSSAYFANRFRKLMPCARGSEQDLNPSSHAGSRRRTGLTHELPDLWTAECLTFVF